MSQVFYPRELRNIQVISSSTFKSPSKEMHEAKWKATLYRCHRGSIDWIKAIPVWPQQLSPNLSCSSSPHHLPTDKPEIYFLKEAQGECCYCVRETGLQQYFSNPCTEKIINTGRAWVIIGKINAWCRGLILQWRGKEEKTLRCLVFQTQHPIHGN